MDWCDLQQVINKCRKMNAGAYKNAKCCVTKHPDRANYNISFVENVKRDKEENLIVWKE